MKKLLFLILFLFLPSLVLAQNPQFSQQYSFTSATTTASIDIRGRGINYYRIEWDFNGNTYPSACSIQLQISSFNITWTTATTGTCTSQGQSTFIQASANFIRLNLATFTAASPGDLIVNISGFTINPSGAGAAANVNIFDSIGANLLSDGSNNLQVNCKAGCSSTSSTTTVMQNATTINSNGTPLSTDNYASAFLTTSCTANDATIINFEAQNDGTNFYPINGSLLGTGTVANFQSCQTSSQIWQFSVAGSKQIRARISLHMGATAVTVTGTSELGAPAFNDINVIGVQGTVTVNNTQQGTASQNVAQIAGTTTDVNSGAKSNGTIRVVLATDQPQLTNKLLVTPDSVALPANQSVNLNQVGGTNTLTGGANGSIGVGGLAASGAATVGNPVLFCATSGGNCQALVMSTNGSGLKVDGSGYTQPVSGTFWQSTQPVSGTFWQSTQPVSIGATVAVSLATSGQQTMANSFPVVIASNQASYGVTVSGSIATGGSVATANPVFIGGYGNADTLFPIITCDNNVQGGGIPAIVSLASSGLTQIIAAPAAGKRIAVCAWDIVAGAATSVQLKSGTGVNCASGGANVTANYSFAANGGISKGSGLGILFALPQASALCVNNSGANDIEGTITYTVLLILMRMHLFL